MSEMSREMSSIGILNSEVNPADLIGYNGETARKLLDALKEYDYLIALMQKSFFDNMQYDPFKSPFDEIPPANVRILVNNVLHKLEEDIWTALRRAESTLMESSIPPHPMDKNDLSKKSFDKE